LVTQQVLILLTMLLSEEAVVVVEMVEEQVVEVPIKNLHLTQFQLQDFLYPSEAVEAVAEEAALALEVDQVLFLVKRLLAEDQEEAALEAVEVLEVAAVAAASVEALVLVLSEETGVQEALMILAEAEAEWLLPTDQQELIWEMLQEELVKAVL
jgi:hypothetical protein